MIGEKIIDILYNMVRILFLLTGAIMILMFILNSRYRVLDLDSTINLAIGCGFWGISAMLMYNWF